jgi:hypothetical protein
VEPLLEEEDTESDTPIPNRMITKDDDRWTLRQITGTPSIIDWAKQNVGNTHIGKRKQNARPRKDKGKEGKDDRGRSVWKWLVDPTSGWRRESAIPRVEFEYLSLFRWRRRRRWWRLPNWHIGRRRGRQHYLSSVNNLSPQNTCSSMPYATGFDSYIAPIPYNWSKMCNGSMNMRIRSSITCWCNNRKQLLHG